MPIIVEVAPNEENVQLPTETTEEWEAAPGGVFAPVGPDTSPGGKVKKAVLRRVHPYRRPSPKEPSTVAGAPACAGTGAAVDSENSKKRKNLPIFEEFDDFVPQTPTPLTNSYVGELFGKLFVEFERIEMIANLHKQAGLRVAYLNKTSLQSRTNSATKSIDTLARLS